MKHTDDYFRMANNGGKYGYNSSEKLLMALITAITNFSSIPTCIIIYKRQLNFPFAISIFTVTSSFMYHLLDSLGIDVFFLEEA